MTHQRNVKPPLAGLRVVEMSTVFMAPYCGKVLADWGADVIKVEGPEGDPVRYINDRTGLGLGPVFVAANQGKRSVEIDAKSPAGRRMLDDLVATADVFIHNVRPSAAERLGIDPGRLLAFNDRLVHCTFRGYGGNGPYSAKPAYDDVIQAASGVAMAQAVNGADPAYWRSAAVDKVMGLYGAAAICAALRGRDDSGTGVAIEVPMFEGMTSFMLLDRQGGWVSVPPDGPSGYSRTDSPYRKPYRTKDGHLAVMLYTDRHWKAFFEVIGKVDVGLDARVANLKSRTENIDWLYAMVEDELADYSTAYWNEKLTEADVPHGPVNDIPDLFDDPHLSSVDFFHEISQPGYGTIRMARSPIDMGSPPLLPRPAPGHGEHTADVFEALKANASHSGEV